MKKLSKQGNYGTVYEGKYKKKKAIYKTNSLPDVNLRHERDVMLVLNSDQRMKSFFPRLLDYKETPKSQRVDRLLERDVVSGWSCRRNGWQAF